MKEVCRLMLSATDLIPVGNDGSMQAYTILVKLLAIHSATLQLLTGIALEEFTVVCDARGCIYRLCIVGRCNQLPLLHSLACARLHKVDRAP